jgi:formylglycine-generating enzyme required for sulfatase activity
MPLTIKNPSDFDLPPDAEQILSLMFADYARVVIVKELKRGFGGGRVFLVHLGGRRHGGEISYLPVVIKVGSVAIIGKEWQAFGVHIRDRLPDIAGIRCEPVIPPGSDWGGLCYPLVGSGMREIVSLSDYCQNPGVGVKDIEFTLKLLLNIVERITEYSVNRNSTELQPYYDRVLPVNLQIALRPVPPHETPVLIKADETPPSIPLQPGDYVRLEGFEFEPEVDTQTMTLNVPPQGDEAPRSYRLRLHVVEKSAAPGQSMEGQVIQTRHGFLQDEIRKALGPDFDLTADEVILPDGRRLPNPLAKLPEILDKIRNIKLGDIHGDLNMENVLIDCQTRAPTLIDFAEARWDHVLHDYLRLETEVVSKLIPPALGHAGLPIHTGMRSFYRQLHHATFGEPPDDLIQPPDPALEKAFTILKMIRKSAQHGALRHGGDCTEYYHGLLLYLLGTLKFQNLDEMDGAKPAVVWGAITLTDLLADPPPPRPYVPQMIKIPAGEFWMGSDPNRDKHARATESLQRRKLLDYYLSKTPITNEHYAIFVRATGYNPPSSWINGQPPPGKEDHPVVNVNWHDARAYCEWLARKTDQTYQLPSEEEWEKGARGSDGRIYPWGDVWEARRCHGRSTSGGDTAPVTSYPDGASPYGLLGMSGNVWEWTSSIFRPDLHDGQKNPPRVIRGGSYISIEKELRCAWRNSHPSDKGSPIIGFRVMRMED